MPPEELLLLIRKRPFVPFRIRLTDGTIYDIRHPEMVMPGHRSAVIGITPDPVSPFYSRTETVALRHIVRLEPLEISAPS